MGAGPIPQDQRPVGALFEILSRLVQRSDVGTIECWIIPLRAVPAKALLMRSSGL